MVLSDDMKTPQGIVEGTAATFSNSWKANSNCPDREERLDDPCSLSVENGKKILVDYSTVCLLYFNLCVSQIDSQL